MLSYDYRLPLSPYYHLYDMLVKKDDKYRKIDSAIDFSFIRQELQDKYCLSNGRNAVDPVILFKYLFVKIEEEMSDIDLVSRSMTDLSIKRFLGYMPEDQVIEPSTLTKFRRLRLNDEELLNKLLAKTVILAKEKGLLKSKVLIVDGTHTQSKFNVMRPGAALNRYVGKLVSRAAELRPAYRDILPKVVFPEDLRDALVVAEHIIDDVKEVCSLEMSVIPGFLGNELNMAEEIVGDIKDHYYVSPDVDSRVGHKSEEKSFYGYKTHIAMNEDRFITAAIVTSGEKGESGYLPDLIEQSIDNGAEVESVVGDAAYGGKGNYDYTKENGIELISKTAPVTEVLNECMEKGFTYNKDSERLVCPQGHEAVKKDVPVKATGGIHTTHYFDVKICRICPIRETCLALKQRSSGKKGEEGYYADIDKVRRPRIEVHQSPERIRRAYNQESDEFRKKYAQRYMIESKNAELKNNHHYGRAYSKGIKNMTMQAAMTMFVVNVKRLVKLSDQ